MSLQLINPSEIKLSADSSENNESGEDMVSISDTTLGYMHDTLNRVGIERVLHAHKIGYACVNMSIDATTNRTCRIDNCNEERLRELIESNLNGMKRIIEWNIQKRIHLYRISSMVIPFASHEINRFPWWDYYKDKLMEIGKIIKDSKMRVSMHPGQYVNINSPDPYVVEFSIKELEYHAKFMNLLDIDNTHRIILHVGGGYGNKKESIKRFIDVFGSLSNDIKSRLTIENDDKIYNVWDVLDLSSQIKIPVVFDLLHHQVNHIGLVEDKDIRLILEKCFSTWNEYTAVGERSEPHRRIREPEQDRAKRESATGSYIGVPKIHLSTQRPGAKYGVHNDSVDIDMLMSLYFEFIDYNFDIMLETKDKDKSVMRAIRILEDMKNWNGDVI